MSTRPIDAITIDVGEVLQRSVTSLYSSLVTRQTGRAVRMAIETQLHGAGARSLSLIDFSEVVVIDFSCADEVVAKLLRRFLDDEACDAYFVFRGVLEPHRDQIETVLERQGLAAVIENRPGRFTLAGVRSESEERVWDALESHGTIEAEQVARVFADVQDQDALASLVRRALAFRSAPSGRVYSLSRLIEHLM